MCKHKDRELTHRDQVNATWEEASFKEANQQSTDDEASKALRAAHANRDDAPDCDD